MTRSAVYVLMLCLITTACGDSEPTAPSPAPSSGYAGRWSGAVVVLPLIPPGAGIPTRQSQPLSFTVSADQRVTDISIGYNFSGCSGVKTFSGLSVPIGASGSLGQQGWAYISPFASDGRDRTELYGQFASDRTASGLAIFADFPGCGSGLGDWTATEQ